MCTQWCCNISSSPKKAANGSYSQGAVSCTMCVKLNAAVFSQEFAELREFVTVQPCLIFLPEVEEGGLWTQLHHHVAKETHFHLTDWLSEPSATAQASYMMRCAWLQAVPQLLLPSALPNCYPPFPKYDRSIKDSKVKQPCVKTV